jgi:uncharacterized caspase-like protein
MILLRLFILVFLALPATAQTKVALVIGNASYTHAQALANPSNDAKAVADKLQGIGFDVALYQNLNGQDFRKALGVFSEKALNADLVVVFYAGHGIEMEGQNYLIPVDAEMKSEATAQFEAVPLEQVLSTVRNARKLGLVMLDACRNNPFAQTMTRKNGTRAVSRGLAPVSIDSDNGLLVSFAAEPGSTADDGDTGHSPYTSALLEVLDRPGLEVSKLFRSVRAKVRQSTDGKQVPIEQMQLPDEDIFLVSAAVKSPAAPKGMTDSSDAVEVTLWQSAEKRGTRESFQAYLDKYPQGTFAAMARQSLDELGGTVAPDQEVNPNGQTETPATLDLPLGKKPPQPDTSSEPIEQGLLGLTLSPLKVGSAEKLGLPADTEGLVVMAVNPASEAYAKGLREGDVITEVGQTSIRALSDFADQIAEARKAQRKSLLVLVRQNGNPRFVALLIGQK